MKTKVFVDGQEGTTGLQIFDRLAARTDVELIRIDPELRKDPATRAECLNAADIAFLCLPDAAARESVALVKNPATCVIDASTAHRTDPDWAYGLPELGRAYREKVKSSKRIANPGCHAAAFELAVRPLVDAKILDAAAPLVCFSITGYSGGGKKMIAQYEHAFSEKLRSPRLYALGLSHKHLPEMRLHAGLASAPIFNPMVGPFAQGLSVTVPLQLDRLNGVRTPDGIQKVLGAAYADEAFVRVLAPDDLAALDDGFWDVQACNGTNRADIAVFGNAHQVALTCRLDNLGKGASGAAIQSMNLHLGLAEDLGLTAA